MHGGKSLAAFASPSFKHGNRSKYLKHLSASKQSRFDENIELAKLPALDDEIALTITHTQELIELLDDSTMLENWGGICSSFAKLRDALNEPEQLDGEIYDHPEVTVEFALSMLENNLAQVSETMKVWTQIHQLNEQSRKLQESHSKIRLANLDEAIKQNKYVPVEFVQSFIASCADLFQMSPPEIRKEQLIGLQNRFNSLPEVVREASAEQSHTEH